LNIICTAGTLYGDLRSIIQRAFPTSCILNQYGSREVGVIACEVHGFDGLAVFDHSVKLEVIDSSTGKPVSTGNGNVIVTQLNNLSMPLIRYDIGDCAQVTDYRQKYINGFPVIDTITGRLNSHFITKTGTRIHGEFFTHLFYGQPWVSQFQVVQRALDIIEIRYVANPGSPVVEQSQKEIIDKIHKIMGDDCSVTFLSVDHIPPLPSGKRQFVWSAIK
jgi:phenylacetate-CoA ligase